MVGEAAQVVQDIMHLWTTVFFFSTSAGLFSIFKLLPLTCLECLLDSKFYSAARH